MDYEKKYKETIAWIDIIMPTLTKEQQEDALENFPELAESEDERIRKDIMVLVKDWWDRVNKDNISTKEQMLAWLERQGDNNNQNWKPSKGQINALEHFVRSIGESGYASPYDENTKLLYSLLNDLCKLEKQDEQKPILDFKASNWYVSKVDGKIHDMTYNPANKINPKFKVDNWIIFNGFIIHIDKVVDGYYITTTFGGIPNSYDWDIDNVARLWTIQDAKDGDVLVVERDKTPFIFKEFDKFHPGCPVAYCGIDDSGIFVNSDDGWWTDEKVYPATKEQRDTLFAKIEEAGYEWNAEKKELKKAYRNPKFNEGDWVVTDKNDRVQIKAVNNSYYTIDNGMYFNIPYVDKCWHLWTIQDAIAGDVLSNGDMILIFKEFEEPAYRQHIIAYIGLDSCGHIQVTVEHWELGIDKVKPATKEQCDTLMKAIKDAGYEWDIEKKELKKIEEDGVENKKQIMSEMVDLVTAYVKQKSEPAWSEEDEERIKNTLSVLDVQVCWDGATGKKGNPYQKEIDWLKSIKERIIWKPSKKQMETLEYYMHTLLATEHKEVLFVLYNDLKKL